jgi:hypothetical protein
MMLQVSCTADCSPGTQHTDATADSDQHLHQGLAHPKPEGDLGNSPLTTITLYPVRVHANDDVDLGAKDLLRELQRSPASISGQCLPFLYALVPINSNFPCPCALKGIAKLSFRDTAEPSLKCHFVNMNHESTPPSA